MAEPAMTTGSEEALPEEEIVPPGPMGWLSPQQIEHLRGYVSATASAEKSARQEKERRWQRLWSMMKGEHEFRAKAKWQSQIVVSKPTTTARAATAVLKAGITQSRDWFTMEAASEEDEPLLPALNKLLRATVEERDPETQQDFLDRWLLGVQAGMATSTICMKVQPKQVRRKRRRFFVMPANQEDHLPSSDEAAMGMGDPDVALGQLGAEVVGDAQEYTFGSELVSYVSTYIDTEMIPSFDVLLDTRSGQPEYVIQIIRGTRSQLDEMRADLGYDESAVRMARDASRGRGSTEDEHSDRSDEQQGGPPGDAWDWHGYEMWGRFYDADGEVLLEDHVVTVINDVVVRVMANPNEDGWAIRTSTLEPQPFSRYGRAPLETGAGIALGIVEMINAVFDATAYDVLKAWEVDLDVAGDPGEFKEGIVPGKTFSKRTLTTKGDRRLLTPVEMGSSATNVIPVIQLLERWWNESMGLSDFGLMPARGLTPPTAAEVADRRDGTNLHFSSMAQWLEKSSLEPTLEAIFNAMMAFRVHGPEGRDWVRKVLGREESVAFYAEILKRLNEGDGSFEMGIEFKVTSLSGIVERAQELEKVARLFEASQGVPGIMKRIRLDELARRVLKILGFDAEGLMKSQDEIREVERREQEVEQALIEGARSRGSNDGAGRAAARSTAAVAGS